MGGENIVTCISQMYQNGFTDYPPWLEKNLKVTYCKYFKMYFRISNVVLENL